MFNTPVNGPPEGIDPIQGWSGEAWVIHMFSHPSPRILMFCSTGILQYLQHLTTTVWGMTIHKSQHIPTILRFFHVFSGQKKVTWPIPIYQNLPDPSERHSWVLRSENLVPGQGTKGRIFCFPTRVNLSTADGAGNSTHDCWIMLPSGKRLHNELEDHHFLAGKIHYVYGHFQRTVTNYQRVVYPMVAAGRNRNDMK